MSEVAYTRGLSNHPLADSRQEVQAGILMSPSDASSSDAGKSEDGDDEKKLPRVQFDKPGGRSLLGHRAGPDVHGPASHHL